MTSDAADGHGCPDQCLPAEAFEALDDREQEGQQRHERQDDLAQPGAGPLEPPIEERERGGEGQQAVQDAANQRSATRQRKAQDGHYGQQDRRGDRKAEGGAPQWRELVVAEAHRDRVAAGEQRADQEGDERCPVAHDRG